LIPLLERSAAAPLKLDIFFSQQLTPGSKKIGIATEISRRSRRRKRKRKEKNKEKRKRKKR
jgi:hypothetical protein